MTAKYQTIHMNRRRNENRLTQFSIRSHCLRTLPELAACNWTTTWALTSQPSDWRG